jgi:hypothetical protein
MPTRDYSQFVIIGCLSKISWCMKNIVRHVAQVWVLMTNFLNGDLFYKRVYVVMVKGLISMLCLFVAYVADIYDNHRL